MEWRGETIACFMPWAVMMHSSHWSDFKRTRELLVDGWIWCLCLLYHQFHGWFGNVNPGIWISYCGSRFGVLVRFLYTLLFSPGGQGKFRLVCVSAGSHLQPLFGRREMGSRNTVRNCCLHLGLFYQEDCGFGTTQADYELFSTIKPSCPRNYCVVLVHRVGSDSMYNVYAEGFLNLMVGKDPISILRAFLCSCLFLGCCRCYCCWIPILFSILEAMMIVVHCRKGNFWLGLLLLRQPFAPAIGPVEMERHKVKGQTHRNYLKLCPSADIY